MLFLFYLLTLAVAISPNVVFNKDVKNVTRVETTVNIISGNHTGYYYATEVFFDSGNIAYMGWQPRDNSYLQHLAFSVFGNGTSSDSDRCFPGADTGSGTSCSMEYPWKFGQNYTIEMVRINHNETDGSNTWEGSIIDDVTNEKTKIAHYTTPKSYGLLTGMTLSFDERYTENSLTSPLNTRECYPESKYIQYAPVLYNEEGEKTQLSFYTFGNRDKRLDKCAYAHDKPNYTITKLSDTAFEFHNGIFTNS